MFEVIDSGAGIPQKNHGHFSKGFSTKGNNRGYGLANMKEMVDLLEGTIEIQNEKNGELFYNLPSKH